MCPDSASSPTAAHRKRRVYTKSDLSTILNVIYTSDKISLWREPCVHLELYTSSSTHLSLICVKPPLGFLSQRVSWAFVPAVAYVSRLTAGGTGFLTCCNSTHFRHDGKPDEVKTLKQFNREFNSSCHLDPQPTSTQRENGRLQLFHDLMFVLLFGL